MSMKKTGFVAVVSLVGLVLALLATVASAQVPAVIHFQGRLLDGGGSPLTGAHTLTFRIYDQATVGNELWEEAHVSVAVSDGFYNVLLGSVTTFASVGLTFNANLWVSIQVDANAEMSPRMRLAASPYALNADRLDGQDSAAFAASAHGHAGGDVSSGTVADARIASTIARDSEIMPAVLAGDGAGSGLDADTVDGIQASALMGTVTYDPNQDGRIDADKIGAGSVTNGEFEYLAAVTSDVQTQLDDKVTAVTAGSGLTGGGTTGSVNLDVNTDGSTLEVSGDAIRVKDAGITSAKLAGSPGNGTAGQTLASNGNGGFSWSTAPPTVQSGSVGLPATASTFGDYTTTLHVTFPSAFTSAPTVTISTSTSSQSVADAAKAFVSNITTTGFDVNVGVIGKTVVVVDNGGTYNVGKYASLYVVNGNPAISYYDNTNGDLKYVRANDPYGLTWGTPVTIDVSGSVGAYSSLRVVNGNPAISYTDNTNWDLKYVRSTDANGSAWGTPVTVDSTGNLAVYGTSLAVVNGNPAIAYNDNTTPGTKYVRATDSDGSIWGTPRQIYTNSGETPSLSVINGYPAIAFGDMVLDDLVYIRATDANGSVWGSIQRPDNGCANCTTVSMSIIDNKPAITYYYNNNLPNYLKYVSALDVTGSAWNAPVQVYSGYAAYASLALVNGYPAISFGGLQYIEASSTNGSTWKTPFSVDNVNPYTPYTSLAVVNGGPAIAYYDEDNGNLKYAFSGTPASEITWIAVGN